ncbi:hypothetical protein Tco_0750218 [Tanacetum coccineum]|uniref:Protein TIC 214 n=1 Tax=Tanacetum coccineum TaxID=301880 RepID=A0ABQ4Z3E0_9ASTR
MTLIKEISTDRESEVDDERLSRHIKYVSQLRLELDHHEVKLNEKKKIHNFTLELRMTPIKEISTNRESKEDDENHLEVKVNEKRKIHNFTPELRMTPIKEISTDRESEGDDEREQVTMLVSLGLSRHIKWVSQLRVEGDHHEDKVNEKRHNFTPELRMTPIKKISTNRESEGENES